MAEFESALIGERTKAGMKAAKRNGKHVGRPPKLSPAQIQQAHKMIAAGQTQASMAPLFGVNRMTIYRALQSQNRDEAA